MGKSIHYPTKDLTIIWKPELCCHSGVCVKTLPKVYHPKERPWVKPEEALDGQALI